MRQFVADCELDSDGCLCVRGKNFRYLGTVLRVQTGDAIYVRLLSGVLQPMTVAKIDSSEKTITLQIAGSNVSLKKLEATPKEKMRGPQLWLFMFVPKPAKMELIIRQAVECGVSVIVPVEGEFCQSGFVQSARNRCEDGDERWPRIVTEARQQSGSPVATKIEKPVSVEEACRMWQSVNADGRGSAVVLYERTDGTKNIYSALENADSKKERVAVAVGAEGGISPAEVKVLSDAGFIPVHLETNILRCETAAIYGIAAVQTVMS